MPVDIKALRQLAIDRAYSASLEDRCTKEQADPSSYLEWQAADEIERLRAELGRREAVQ